MLPVWLPLTLILLNFVLTAFCFRYARELSTTGFAVRGAMLYFLGLGAAVLILIWSCRHYEVSREALGIRPSSMRSDFLWSFRICLLAGSAITAVIVIGAATALSFGIRLPAPSLAYVHVLGGPWNDLQFLAIAGLGGAIATIVAPVTEELIYRSLFLPPLTHRFGLYPAIVVTSLMFGLAHTIPFGQLRIPITEIVGGSLMAMGFAIRWSVVPAMVIHALGNLVVGVLVLTYVRLFIAYPALFTTP
jgi:membrane protease YdiL (CAAX protease family)